MLAHLGRAEFGAVAVLCCSPSAGFLLAAGAARVYLWWSMGYAGSDNSGMGNAAAADRPAEEDRTGTEIGDCPYYPRRRMAAGQWNQISYQSLTALRATRR